MKPRLSGCLAAAFLYSGAQAAPVGFAFEAVVDFDASRTVGTGTATEGDLFAAFFGEAVLTASSVDLGGSLVFDSASPVTEANDQLAGYDLAITAGRITSGNTILEADVDLITANSGEGLFNFAASPDGTGCLGGTDAVCPGLSPTANFVGVGNGVTGGIEGPDGQPRFVRDVDIVTLRLGGTPLAGEFGPPVLIDGLGAVSFEYVSIDLVTTEGQSILFDTTDLPSSPDVFTSDLLANSIIRIAFSSSITDEIFEFTTGFGAVGGFDAAGTADPVPLPPAAALFLTAGAFGVRAARGKRGSVGG